jgi:AAA+ superfamily predicted ATPase
MTTLLTRAFERVSKDFARARRTDGRAAAMGVLLVDEADALAQSRELAQMHHEDRAGVNALLRGIDGIRSDRLPVLTILCTNRLDAIDPAVQRRAAAVEMFERPGQAQRAALLTHLLAGTLVAPT